MVYKKSNNLNYIKSIILYQRVTTKSRVHLSKTINGKWRLIFLMFICLSSFSFYVENFYNVSVSLSVYIFFCCVQNLISISLKLIENLISQMLGNVYNWTMTRQIMTSYEQWTQKNIFSFWLQAHIHMLKQKKTIYLKFRLNDFTFRIHFIYFFVLFFLFCLFVYLFKWINMFILVVVVEYWAVSVW